MMDEKQIFRSIGKAKTGGQLGFGFMHKKGKTVDEENSLFRFYSIVYVIRGYGTYIDDSGNKYPLSPGSIFQRFPEKRHSTYIDPDSNWSECYMDFGANIFNFLAAINVINREQPVHKIKPDISIEEDIFSHIISLENCPEHKLPDLLIDSFNLLRGILSRSEDLKKDFDPHGFIEKSCSDFSHDYAKRIELKDYCRKNGWGYESFRKLFKIHIGMSPGKYIVRRRIDMACQLLRGSNKSVGEISYELGYRSQYEFSAQFKRLIGISPNYYRNKK